MDCDSNQISSTLIDSHQHSPTLGSLAAALARVQAKLRPAKLDSINPFFKSKYASLDSCWDACREQLAVNELAVIQTPVASNNGRLEIRTILVHSSGEWISGTISMQPKDDTPQGIGSTITYGRRYGLCSLVGVTAGDDDDGNVGTQPGKKTPPPRNPQKKADAESSPATQLWARKAMPGGVPPEEWKLWCKELEVGKDRRTQTKKRMAALEEKVDEWIAAHAEPAEARIAQVLPSRDKQLRSEVSQNSYDGRV